MRPVGGVAVDDLRPLLFDAVAPVVTVLLATDPDDANPGPRWDQRWKTVRRELDGLGAGGALTALDEAVVDAYRRGHAFYAVADAGRLWVSESWPEPPRQELTMVGPLPRLAPLVEHRQRTVPHVVALVDRQGADIVVTGRDGEYDRTVEGASGPDVRRSSPGGWSQRHHEERAQGTWARTARSIAETLVDVVDEEHAEVVVLAGDVREVQLVRDVLPERVSVFTHVVQGNRAAGTDEAARDREVARLVHTAVADSTVALLQRLRQELGQHDLAVVGASDTFDALIRGQVDVLLVHDDPADARVARFGDTPDAIALADARPASGSSAPHEGRLVDVAIRSAVGTGAGVRIVPTVDALTDGIGAILRWAPGP